MQILHTIYVKLLENSQMKTPITEAFYINTVVTGHSTITIIQSISGSFFLPFVATNSKLWNTFGLNIFNNQSKCMALPIL